MTKGRKKKKKSGLFGITAASPSKGVGSKEIGFAMLSFVGGSFLGAVFGKPSGVAGIMIAGGGAYMKNLYAASLGAGMLIGAKISPEAEKGTSGISDEEMDGLSMEAMKERAKNYFKEMGEKLYLPVSKEAPSSTSTSSTTQGLDGGEDVTYFLNPHTNQNENLDLRELDKLQEQVAQMNGTAMGEFGEEENY